MSDRIATQWQPQLENSSIDSDAWKPNTLRSKKKDFDFNPQQVAFAQPKTEQENQSPVISNAPLRSSSLSRNVATETAQAVPLPTLAMNLTKDREPNVAVTNSKPLTNIDVTGAGVVAEPNHQTQNLSDRTSLALNIGSDQNATVETAAPVLRPSIAEVNDPRPSRQLVSEVPNIHVADKDPVPTTRVIPESVKETVVDKVPAAPPQVAPDVVKERAGGNPVVSTAQSAPDAVQERVAVNQVASRVAPAAMNERLADKEPVPATRVIPDSVKEPVSDKVAASPIPPGMTNAHGADNLLVSMPQPAPDVLKERATDDQVASTPRVAPEAINDRLTENKVVSPTRVVSQSVKEPVVDKLAVAPLEFDPNLGKERGPDNQAVPTSRVAFAGTNEHTGESTAVRPTGVVSDEVKERAVTNQAVSMKSVASNPAIESVQRNEVVSLEEPRPERTKESPIKSDVVAMRSAADLLKDPVGRNEIASSGQFPDEAVKAPAINEVANVPHDVAKEPIGSNHLANPAEGLENKVVGNPLTSLSGGSAQSGVAKIATDNLAATPQAARTSEQFEAAPSPPQILKGTDIRNSIVSNQNEALLANHQTPNSEIAKASIISKTSGIEPTQNFLEPNRAVSRVMPGDDGQSLFEKVPTDRQKASGMNLETAQREKANEPLVVTLAVQRASASESIGVQEPIGSKVRESTEKSEFHDSAQRTLNGPSEIRDAGPKIVASKEMSATKVATMDENVAPENLKPTNKVMQTAEPKQISETVKQPGLQSEAHIVDVSSGGGRTSDLQPLSSSLNQTELVANRAVEANGQVSPGKGSVTDSVVGSAVRNQSGTQPQVVAAVPASANAVNNKVRGSAETPGAQDRLIGSNVQAQLGASGGRVSQDPPVRIATSIQPDHQGEQALPLAKQGPPIAQESSGGAPKTQFVSTDAVRTSANPKQDEARLVPQTVAAVEAQKTQFVSTDAVRTSANLKQDEARLVPQTVATVGTQKAQIVSADGARTPSNPREDESRLAQQTVATPANARGELTKVLPENSMVRPAQPPVQGVPADQSVASRATQPSMKLPSDQIVAVRADVLSTNNGQRPTDASAFGKIVNGDRMSSERTGQPLGTERVDTSTALGTQLNRATALGYFDSITTPLGGRQDSRSSNIAWASESAMLRSVKFDGMPTSSNLLNHSVPSLEGQISSTVRLAPNDRAPDTRLQGDGAATRDAVNFVQTRVTRSDNAKIESATVSKQDASSARVGPTSTAQIDNAKVEPGVVAKDLSSAQLVQASAMRIDSAKIELGVAPKQDSATDKTAQAISSGTDAGANQRVTPKQDSATASTREVANNGRPVEGNGARVPSGSATNNIVATGGRQAPNEVNTNIATRGPREIVVQNPNGSTPTARIVPSLLTGTAKITAGRNDAVDGRKSFVIGSRLDANTPKRFITGVELAVISALVAVARVRPDAQVAAGKADSRGEGASFVLKGEPRKLADLVASFSARKAKVLNGDGCEARPESAGRGLRAGGLTLSAMLALSGVTRASDPLLVHEPVRHAIRIERTIESTPRRDEPERTMDARHEEPARITSSRQIETAKNDAKNTRVSGFTVTDEFGRIERNPRIEDTKQERVQNDIAIKIASNVGRPVVAALSGEQVAATKPGAIKTEIVDPTQHPVQGEIAYMATDEVANDNYRFVRKFETFARTESIKSPDVGEQQSYSSTVPTGSVPSIAGMQFIEVAEISDEAEIASEEIAQKKVLYRPTWLVRPGDTLVSIAEMFFQDRDLGWLIADLNSQKLRQSSIDGKRVVEVRTREKLELPVAEDIVEFYRNRPSGSNFDRLITIVVESQIDRELLDGHMSKLMLLGGRR